MIMNPLENPASEEHTVEEPTPKELTPEEKPEQARRAIIERIGVYQPQIRHSEPEVRPVENPLAPVAARHKTYRGFLLRLKWQMGYKA